MLSIGSNQARISKVSYRMNLVECPIYRIARCGSLGPDWFTTQPSLSYIWELGPLAMLSRYNSRLILDWLLVYIQPGHIYRLFGCPYEHVSPEIEYFSQVLL